MAEPGRPPRALPLPWEDDQVAADAVDVSLEADGIAGDWYRLARARPRRSEERTDALSQARSWRSRSELHADQALLMTESQGQA